MRKTFYIRFPLSFFSYSGTYSKNLHACFLANFLLIDTKNLKLSNFMTFNCVLFVASSLSFSKLALLGAYNRTDSLAIPLQLLAANVWTLRCLNSNIWKLRSDVWVGVHSNIEVQTWAPTFEYWSAAKARRGLPR